MQKGESLLAQQKGKSLVLEMEMEDDDEKVKEEQVKPEVKEVKPEQVKQDIKMKAEVVHTKIKSEVNCRWTCVPLYILS